MAERLLLTTNVGLTMRKLDGLRSFEEENARRQALNVISVNVHIKNK